MIIAVNTRLLLKNKLEGIGWFSFESLKRITRQHPEHQFVFIFDKKYDDAFIFAENVKPIVLSPPTRHPVLWYIWFEFRIPKLLKDLKADLFFSPDGYLSLRSKTKSTATIHDINFEHRPKDLPLLKRIYYRFFFPRYARKAKRITTVSEYSKKDIVETYQVEASKIDVVYNGSNTLFSPLPDNEKEKVKKRVTSGKAYFVFIGALHPRKNVCNLLMAFNEFKEKTKLNYKLVIVGEKMFKNKDLNKTFNNMKHKEEVVFSGRLNPLELKEVLASALALAFVPYFEGFGIPLVEAMYCDVPLIASNVTSLPEVAGNAAIYADPNSVTSIAECMEKIATDSDLRKELIEKGKIQRQKFSWDLTAKRLWESIEKCLGD